MRTAEVISTNGQPRKRSNERSGRRTESETQMRLLRTGCLVQTQWRSVFENVRSPVFAETTTPTQATYETQKNNVNYWSGIFRIPFQRQRRTNEYVFIYVCIHRHQRSKKREIEIERTCHCWIFPSFFFSFMMCFLLLFFIANLSIVLMDDQLHLKNLEAYVPNRQSLNELALILVSYICLWVRYMCFVDSLHL